MSNTKRYRGFISYSQHDKKYARKLHKWLEAYRVPRSLTANLPKDSKRRLGRFFRDDEEMGAATDLGAALRGAISDAECLIVICSPRSAQSKWVNEEILHFKRTGRAQNIFAVIVDGAPNSNDTQTECFPPALRYALDQNGDLSDEPVEPLGLNWRKESRGRMIARLAAGVLNVDFDTLWQRHKKRARFRLACTAMGTAAGLAATAAGLLLLESNFRQQSVRFGQQDAARRAQNAIAEGKLEQAIRLTVRNLQLGEHRFSRDLLEDALSKLDAYHIPHSVLFSGRPDTQGKFHRILQSGFGSSQPIAKFTHDERFAIIVTSSGGALFDRQYLKYTPVATNIERASDIAVTEGGFVAVFVNKPIALPPDYNPSNLYDVVVIDIPSGQQLAAIQQVSAHAISPDGLVLFLAHQDGRNCFYDMTTGSETGCLPKMSETPINAVFAKETNRIAVVDASGDIQIFDVAQLMKIATLKSTNRDIFALEFAQVDERLIVHYSPSGVIHQTPAGGLSINSCDVENTIIYNIANQTDIRSLSNTCKRPNISKDGLSLLSTRAKVDLQTGALSSMPIYNGDAYATSANGEMLAASINDQIVVLDSETTAELARFDGFASKPQSLIFINDDTQIFGVDEEGFGLIWHLFPEWNPSASMLRTFPNRVSHVLPKQDRALSWSDNEISIWRLSDGEKELIYQPLFPVTQTTLSSNGKHLAIGDSYGNVIVFGTDPAKETPSTSFTEEGLQKLTYGDALSLFSTGKPVQKMMFDKDGDTLVVVSGEADPLLNFVDQPNAPLNPNRPKQYSPKYITSWQISSEGKLANKLSSIEIPNQSQHATYVLSGDGKVLLTKSTTGGFEISNTVSGKKTKITNLPDNFELSQISNLALDHDGSQAFVQNWEKGGGYWTIINLKNGSLFTSDKNYRLALPADDLSRVFTMRAQKDMYKISAVDTSSRQEIWTLDFPKDDGQLNNIELDDAGSLIVKTGHLISYVNPDTGEVLRQRTTISEYGSEIESPNFFVERVNSASRVWSRKAVDFVAASPTDLLIAAVCDIDQGELFAGKRIIPSDEVFDVGNYGLGRTFGAGEDVCVKPTPTTLRSRISDAWSQAYDVGLNITDNVWGLIH